jgi:TolB-like protein
VANAVKEIITAIKNPDTQTSPIFVNNLPPSVSSRNRKPIFISIALLLVLIGGYVLYQRSSTNNAPSKEVDKSIAVLPFADMSPSRDQEYFGDGMAEEIINVLAQAEDLKVIARTSSFQFKGKNEDLRTIGSKLGVSTILEGSVRKSENLLRNTAQLINTEDGTHLWSKTFDRQPADIFKVQDEIAKAVATALKATLTTGVATQTKMAWNEEAQKEYQLGWKYFAHGDVIDYEIAYPHFKKSVMLDSTTAIAYPFLYFLSNNSGLEPNPKKYLDRALALSPQLPEARIYYSFWHMGQFDFVRAQDEMNKALKFGPRNAIVLRSACRVKTVLGKHEEAIKLGEEAVAVDPLLYFSYISLSIAYERAGKYQQAIENIKKARGINRRTDDLLVINYVLNNQMKDAIDENKKEKGDLHDFHEILIQVKLKQVVKANQLLDAFSKKGGDGLHFWRCALASAYSGNNDQAFEWLEKCFQSKEINLTWVKDHPLLKNLEADPRFKAFLKKLNFPED